MSDKYKTILPYILCIVVNFYHAKCSAQVEFVLLDTQVYTLYRDLTYADFQNHDYDKDSAMFQKIGPSGAITPEIFEEYPAALQLLLTVHLAVSSLGLLHMDTIVGDKFYYFSASVFVYKKSHMFIHDSDILLHEQIHFDIAELVSRQLKMAIHSGKYNLRDPILTEMLIKKYRDSADVLHSIFDRASVQQNEIKLRATDFDFLTDYQATIKMELNKLKQFAPARSFVYLTN